MCSIHNGTQMHRNNNLQSQLLKQHLHRKDLIIRILHRNQYNKATLFSSLPSSINNINNLLNHLDFSNLHINQ